MCKLEICCGIVTNTSLTCSFDGITSKTCVSVISAGVAKCAARKLIALPPYPHLTMRLLFAVFGKLTIALVLFVCPIQSFFSLSFPHINYSAIYSRHRSTLRVIADNGDSPSSVVESHVEETKVSNSDMFTREVIVTYKIPDLVEEVKKQTPYDAEVSKYQNKLEKELEYIQSVLTCEQGLLKLRKDSITVSGKNGYFFVQAEVAEFQRKKDTEQKARILRNKKEFVQKMLPVVDAFRAAPIVAPAENEREENMHKNFGSLRDSILVVFEKYGFKEFDSGK